MEMYQTDLEVTLPGIELPKIDKAQLNKTISRKGSNINSSQQKTPGSTVFKLTSVGLKKGMVSGNSPTSFKLKDLQNFNKKSHRKQKLTLDKLTGRPTTNQV